MVAIKFAVHAATALMLLAVAGTSQSFSDPTTFPAPRLIGIGCQKCGTSSLSDYLNLTSWGYQGLKKELHFFNRRSTKLMGKHALNANDESMLRRLQAEYYQKWSRDRDGIPYEITPAYMNDRRAPLLMYHILKPHIEHVRLLVILRNPAKRAFSGMFQVSKAKSGDAFDKMIRDEMKLLAACYDDTMLLNGTCSDGDAQYSALDQCVDAFKAKARDQRPWFKRFIESMDVSEKADNPHAWQYEGIVLRGMYADQIRTFLCAGFKPHQFFITTSAELRISQVDVLDRLAAFLGVDNGFVDEDARQQVEQGIFRNSKSKGEIKDSAYKALKQFYEPYNRDLYHLLTTQPFAVEADSLRTELGLEGSK